ncbi:MAG: asparagine synthase (glutamine-hydrolyzing) [Candidatus Nanopelagicales bacterium]|nr:asparagine synthase (glutamine-hydrolyzing) [Candidatus Nanopelagicales bacterium]
MCGIFGVIQPSGVTDSLADTTNHIGEFLLHRGPDGSGYIKGPAAYLAMHRLSIMDVQGGGQPFWSENHQIGVLGNGEIYNASELRAGLLAAGHSFTSTSDMEVVPHLIEAHGLDGISRLRGMFALVVSDKEMNAVHLIRDRMGEKPIIYYRDGNATFFASEQSALIKSKVVPSEIDPGFLSNYLLHGFVPEPHSLVTGVHKVPAGHILSISLTDGSHTLKQYWDPMEFVGSKPLNTKDLREVIEESIEVSCTSDRPVGISLSGGLDSSLVAALATTHRTELHAFTVGYEANGFDEAAQANEFASKLGIPCHTRYLDTREVAHSFSDICSWRDEPIADIAGPSIAAVAKMAEEEHVPVLLTGLGGDELFWGYSWVNNLAISTRRYLGQQGSRSLKDFYSPPPRGKQGLFDWGLNWGGIRSEVARTRFMKNWATHTEVPIPLYEFQYGYRSINQQIQAICGKVPSPEFLMPPDPDLVDAFFTNAQLVGYLRVNGLTQVDRLSMHYSIESRVPLIDHKLVEYVMSARVGSSYSQEPQKMSLREVAKQILPPEVMNRPKRGFTPPVRTWLREIWGMNHDALNADALSQIPDINIHAIRTTMANPINKTGQVNQMALRLLTLELWARSLASQ